jgi:hypothetical protein
MAETALQVFLKEVYFDEPTLRRAMYGYVVSIVRMNTSSDAQVYITSPSFPTAKRDGKRKTHDCMYAWDGTGKLVFSGPLETFDSLDIDLYFIRDRSKVREAGELLEELFSDDGGPGSTFLEGAASIGTEVLSELTEAVALAQPAGQVLKLGGEVAKIIGGALKKKGDRTLIHASGTLTREQLQAHRERYSDAALDESHTWGRHRGDKGYFRIDIVQREVEDASTSVNMVEFPKAVIERLDRAINKRTGMN